MSSIEAPVTQAMVMAAGLGTRLRPFTEREPKAFLPLMGVPMAQFALDSLAAAGVRDVAMNVHHLAEKAMEGARRLELRGMRLTVSDESAELLGSAGGLRKALPLLPRGAFFLLNADVLCSVDLAALARQHARLRASHGVTLTLTVFARGPQGGKYREIVLDPSTGLIRGLGELQAGRPFFVGAAVLEPEALAGVPHSGPAEFVPTVLGPAIREEKAGYFAAEGIWQDVGSPELWLTAHLELIRALETGRLPSAWRARIESVNKRIAPEIWVSRTAPFGRNSVAWGAPAYWNPLGDECASVPRELGPEAVLYGTTPQDQESVLRSGIGFRGLWVARQDLKRG